MEQPSATYQAPQQMTAEKNGLSPMGSDMNLKSHQHGSRYGNKWLFGFFDCCSPLPTCCLATWCPCILFGKTYAREHGESDTSGCNWMCCAWYCAASVGFNSCLQCIFRGQQRERHGIEGSALADFCGTCWCPCCTLVQEEKESIVRNTGIDPKTKIAYQPVNQMNYSA